MRTRLDVFPTLVAGAIQASASVVIAQWQIIPGRADLIRFYTVPIATPGRMDQSHGPNLTTFDATPATSAFAQPFLVEGGRDYLFGVLTRVQTWSSITDSQGRPIPYFEQGFSLWAQHNADIPRIKVEVVTSFAA